MDRHNPQKWISFRSAPTSKYQNTDLVSSVSSKAENLAPKRIAQIAQIAAAVASIAGGGAAAEVGIKEQPLQPFSLPVPSGDVDNVALKLDPDDTDQSADWRYSFVYDSKDPPSASLSIDSFATATKDTTVNYWPVPACRSALLTLHQQSNNLWRSFHLVVSNSEHVRLESLPFDGKLEFGTICGSSGAGNSAGDTLTEAADDLQALQQAVKSVNKGSAATTPAASSDKKPKAAN